MIRFAQIISGILEKPQKAYPSMTLTKAIFLLQLLQRLDLLFSNDQYNLALYSDGYNQLLKQIFRASTMIDNMNSTLQAILLIMLYVYAFGFTAILIGMRVYPKVFLKHIIFEKYIYLSLVYTKYAALIPINQLFILSIQQGYQYSVLSILGLIIMSLMVSYQVFYTRTYEIEPENHFKRKYSVFAQILPFFNMLVIGLNYIQITNFVIVLRLLCSYFLGIIWLLEIYEYHAFTPTISKWAFQCSVIYLSITACVTLAVLQWIQVNQLFSVIIGCIPFSLAISHSVYENMIFKLFSQQSYADDYQLLFVLQIINDLSLGNSLKWCIYSQQLHRLNISNPTDLMAQLLLNEILRCKQNKKENIEFLRLTSIYFQVQMQKSFLPAYIALKRYQAQQHYHTIYFKGVIQVIDNWIKSIILAQQSKMRVNEDVEGHRSLSIYQIQQGQDIENHYLPMISDLINQKIKYWERLNNGYAHIQEFQRQTMIISRNTLKLQKLIEKELDVDLSRKINKKFNTVSELKLLSLFCGVALSDIENCIHCQTEIEQILHEERQLDMYVISNLTTLQLKVAILHISVVRNRGELINRAKNLNLFFNITEEMFKNVFHINTLMPKFISIRHERILDRFIQNGTSARFNNPKLVFIQSLKNGTLSQADIKTANLFQQNDDYVLSASLHKVREWADFFIFDQTGKILGCSAGAYQYLEEIIPYEQLVKFSYIFQLFPDIVQNLENIKAKSAHDQVDFEFKSKFNISTYEFLTGFKTEQTTYHVKMDFYDETLQQRVIHKTNSEISFIEIQLFEPQYQSQVKQYLEHATLINCKETPVSLKLRSLGQGSEYIPYFYMEIGELSNEKATMTMATSNSSTEKQTQPAPSRSQSAYQYEQPENIQSEVIDVKPQINAFAIHDLSGPLSKRAIFEIPPFSFERKLEGQINLLDQEFQDISQNISHQLEKVNVDDSRKQFSSSKEYGEDKKLPVIFMKTKDIDVLQSQHSFQTNTSNRRDTVIMLRSIKYNTNYNNLLKIILFINSFQFVILCVYLIIKIYFLSVTSTSLETIIAQMSQPKNLGLRFTKSTTYAWLYFANQNNLIQFSQLEQTALLYDASDSLNKIHSGIASAYNAFVQLENKGLIEQFNFINIYTMPQPATFTELFYQFRTNYEPVLDLIKSQAVINESYKLCALFLKSNTETLQTLISNLIVGMITWINQTIDNQKTQDIYLFVIFDAFLCTMILSQLIFWLQHQQFKQRIAQNLAKINEDQSIMLISKLRAINSSIETWKKQDYAQILNTTSHLTQKKEFRSLHYKINDQTININKQLILISLLLLVYFGYFLGGYELEVALDRQHAPLQDLTTQFIQYTYQTDIKIYSLFMVKLEYLLMPVFKLQIENSISKQLTQLNSTGKLIEIMITDIKQTASLSTIYPYLIGDDSLSSSAKQQLLQLYSDDLCSTLTNMTFCYFSESNSFAEKYGSFYQTDNNRDIVKEGLLGLDTYYAQLISQSYWYEMQNNAYVQNLSLIKNFTQTSDFMNLVNYFLNYRPVYDTFVQILLDNMINAQSHTQTMATLYYSFGFLLTSVLTIISFWYIKKVNFALHMLRMGIVNLPIELLNDIQNRQWLKQIESN